MNRPLLAARPAFGLSAGRLGRGLAVVLLLLLAAVLPGPAQAPGPASSPLPVLTSVAQILQLGRDGVAHRRHPVDFEAVVTLPFALTSALWAQDSSGAVFVYFTNGFQRAAAQRVRVRGTTGPGRIAPWVENARIDVLGPGTMPEPLRLPVWDLAKLENFGRWVEVEGIFRAASNDAGVVKATLVSATFPVNVRLPPVPAPVLQQGWIERSARVRGVCWTEVDSKRNSAGFTLHVPGTNEVEWLATDAPGRGAMPPDPLGAGLALLPRLFGSPRSPANISNTLPVLTNVQQVLALGLEGARTRPHPVNLVGVVTYPGSGNGSIYVEDGTGAIQVIYTYTDNLPNRYPGQVVWVDGIVGAGPVKPWIAEARLKVINRMPLPVPRRLPAAELVTGQWHGHRVQVEGVVRDIVRGSVFSVLVASDGRHLEAEVPHRSARIGPLPMDWFDARVRLRGLVINEVDTRGRPTITRLLLNDSNDLAIVRPGNTNLFGRPLARVAEQRGRTQGADELVKLAGTVLFQSASGRLFLRGADGPFQAVQLDYLPRRGSRVTTLPRPEPEPLRPGDQVELVGAPAASGLAPVFLDAEYRRLGPGPAPAPRAVRAASAAAGQFDADLVSLRARVIGRETRMVEGVEHELLQLQENGSVFEALWERQGTNSLPATSRDTMVRVAGICTALPASAGQIGNFRLLIREPADVQVLGLAAPWESLQPGRILAVSGGLGAFALLWIAVLRRQVGQRRQAEEKARRSETVTRTINYFATSLLERNTEEEIVWDLARNCVSQLGFVDCVIYLLDPERQILVQKAAFGPKNPAGEAILNPITLPLGHGIVGSVAQSRQAEIIADTRQDPRYVVDDAPRLSEITVPIVAGDRILGVIDSEHPQRGFFTPEHLEILTSIASLCANKLVRARAEQKLRELNTDLERRVAERTTELAEANTHLKQAEQELLKALAQEKQLSELKSRFVAMVSHEFRTPLGIITSSAEILEAYLDRLSGEDRQANLRDITDATRHMSRMMEEVLLLGRVEAGKLACRPAPLDLAVFCQRLADEMTSATACRCPIHLVTPPGMAEARADESLLRHILTNLLNNAVKYSRPGAPVEFRVEARSRMALFTVSDSGIGIPDADARLLFTAFHRGRNVGDTPGTGLGMTIVKRCVELHGGRIAFESKEGHGTTFVVALPLFGDSPSAPGESTTQFIRAGNANLTVVS